MSKLAVQKLVGALVLITLGVAIGCGDGKVHHQRMNKLPATGSRDGQMLNGTVGGLGNAANNAATLGGEAAIAQQIAADTSYPTIDINAFPHGTYTLTTTETLFKFTPDASSKWVQFLAQSTVQVSADHSTAVVSNNAKPMTVGVLNNQTDPGSGVTIPVWFKVGPDVAFTNHNDGGETDQIFVNQVATAQSAIVSKDRIVSQWNPAVSLEAIIAGAIGDKSTTATLQKVSDTKYQVVLHEDAPQTSTKTPKIYRTMVFVYTFVPEPAKAAPGGVKKAVDDGSVTGDGTSGATTDGNGDIAVSNGQPTNI